MRRLAGPRHLAGPHLVEDLARLRVVPRVVRRGLEPGKHLERRHGEGRDEGDRLERRDDAVPPEQRREPRDPGREVMLAGQRPVVAEHREVADGTGQRPIQQLVVRIDMTGPRTGARAERLARRVFAGAALAGARRGCAAG